MNRRQIAPFGTWKSPITASKVADAGTTRGSIEEIRLQRGGAYWIEIRTDQGGRSCLYHYIPGRAAAQLLPEGFSARTRVHEYGGGALLAGSDRVFFSNYSDQRMYSLVPGQAPRPITPTPETPAGLRYADGVLTPDERSIICVREAHVPGGVVNDLALIDTDVRAEPRTLAAGHDFYAFPRLDPSGQRLAFTTWDHPRMPWEGTELWVAQFDAGQPRYTPQSGGGCFGVDLPTGMGA